MFDPELFWGEILSEDPARIRQAFDSLPEADERVAVLAHLRKMTTEEGWQEGQRQTAQAALKALLPEEPQ